MTISKVGVVGAGTMGSGIAQVVASAGLQVVMIDVSKDALARGIHRITGNLDRLIQKQKLTAENKDAVLGAIATDTNYDALAPADAVVEAATENAEVKSQIVKQIDGSLRPDAMMCSTTSSISITKLAALVSNPGRFVGMHFFNPVPVMSLVEIVRGLQTTDATHDLATALAQKLGKKPISVKNTPGFVVNRILLPMINEAFFVLAEGDASPAEIDDGMKLGCNHPMGPLALADLVGLDVLLSVMDVLHTDFADSKYRPCPLLKEMVDAGYLGRKTGRGVYRY